MTIYRTGSHWGVTIVREGVQPADANGKRPDAELVAVVTNGDRELAKRICDLLNEDDRNAPPPDPNARRCPCCGKTALLGRWDICVPCAALNGWEPECPACIAEMKGAADETLSHVDTCGPGRVAAR